MRTSKIKELMRLLEESELKELEITLFGGRKIRLSKGITNSNGDTYTEAIPVGGAAGLEPVNINSNKGETTSADKDKTNGNLVEIKSPMVGTFYRAPSPDSEPYVEIGNRVSEGEVVCIVEAMKLMNEIKSEINGIVKNVAVENAQPVEYGQVLFLVDQVKK
ncbi:acetyl-CoA carboxylase biotin carboxyl carrier protein [bacterium]|nr:acetyl-CoA carboxylase biotin carboxyl carrier protein [bacterium]